MAYFMLYIREEGVWAPQFGDKDQDCVREEAREMVRRDKFERGSDAIRVRDTRTVRFPRVPTQKQVMAKCAELNATVGRDG